MKRRILTLGTMAIAMSGSIVLTGGNPSEAVAASKSDASRYPYDPACAWGRLADGRGMLVRCLTQPEAQRLMGELPTVTAEGSATAPAEAPSAPEADPAKLVRVRATVHPAVADEGRLPSAHAKLKSARGRFEECVNKNGGLNGADKAEVHVRFLVRERGRAEGVSVAKRVGVSDSAARCVADVVDRRAVGVPEAPMVGATIVIDFVPER